MPKVGFKSITVSDTVYDKFYEVYKKRKDELAMQGVNSFSGYVTFILVQMMQKNNTFAKSIKCPCCNGFLRTKSHQPNKSKITIKIPVERKK